MPSKREQNEERKAKEGTNEATKAKEEGRKESEKKKSRLLCHFKTQELSQKLIFCICIRRLQSVRPVNSFVVSFSSAQKMA